MAAWYPYYVTILLGSLLDPINWIVTFHNKTIIGPDLFIVKPEDAFLNRSVKTIEKKVLKTHIILQDL